MANRKQFASVAPVDPGLVRLLNESRGREITNEELREQRISFAYGNALNLEGITKDSVRIASENVRLIR